MQFSATNCKNRQIIFTGVQTAFLSKVVRTSAARARAIIYFAESAPISTAAAAGT